MRVFLSFVLCIIFSLPVAVGQNSLILQSNGSIESNIYHNSIVEYDGGYFFLCNTEENKANLIISKYNNCHQHLWTKEYDANLDLSVNDALVHNDQLVILLVTHFNSSSTRTPILLGINMNGEILFSNQYNKEDFDNYYNLSRYENSYHIFGPSSDFPDGGGHFAIDDNGDVIYANVLINRLFNIGTDFGCVILANGLVIRRNDNTLIACDQAQNKLNLFKMDFQGNILWSISMIGRQYNAPMVYKSGVISFIWQMPISETEFSLAYTELNENTGDVITTKVFEFDEGMKPTWPKHTHGSSGDLLITGSNRQSDSYLQDFIYINPHLSDCVLTNEITSPQHININLEDVADNFDLNSVNISQTVTSFTIRDKNIFLEPDCKQSHVINIDTSLDCNNSFVFEEKMEDTEFLWSDGRTDSIRTFNEAIDLSVRIINCNSTREVFLNIAESNCACNVFVPNIIYSDAINPENRQLSIFSNCNFETYSILIYDRWGNLVFHSNDVNESWNPNKLKNLIPGVYTWTVEWTSNIDERTHIEFGTISWLK